MTTKMPKNTNISDIIDNAYTNASNVMQEMGEVLTHEQSQDLRADSGMKPKFTVNVHSLATGDKVVDVEYEPSIPKPNTPLADIQNNQSSLDARVNITKTR